MTQAPTRSPQEGPLRVLLRCPLTDRLVATGLAVDDVRDARRLVPASGVVTHCDACGRRHAWHRAEVVLAGHDGDEGPTGTT